MWSRVEKGDRAGKATNKGYVLHPGTSVGILDLIPAGEL